jgi:phosphoribosyl 1,2-cyclic phosphodiesterase
LLVTEQARVLVDAGFSARKLEQLLAAEGEALSRIDAIFLTHEHGDHTAGIEGLKKFPNIEIYANSATAKAVQQGLSHRPVWKIFDTGASFRFRDLEVRSFSVPHDAHEPVGFRFSTGQEGDLFSPRRSLAWLTDLGHVPAHVHDALRGVEVVAIEANHCVRMLQADLRRPWSTKQRISGRHGHLSNDAVRELLAAVASPSWRRIYLTHLSRDCNSAEAVHLALAPLRITLSCEFSVVNAGEGSQTFEW